MGRGLRMRLRRRILFNRHFLIHLETKISRLQVLLQVLSMDRRISFNLLNLRLKNLCRRKKKRMMEKRRGWRCRVDFLRKVAMKDEKVGLILVMKVNLCHQNNTPPPVMEGGCGSDGRDLLSSPRS